MFALSFAWRRSRCGACAESPRRQILCACTVLTPPVRTEETDYLQKLSVFLLKQSFLFCPLQNSGSCVTAFHIPGCIFPQCGNHRVDPDHLLLHISYLRRSGRTIRVIVTHQDLSHEKLKRSQTSHQNKTRGSPKNPRQPTPFLKVGWKISWPLITNSKNNLSVVDTHVQRVGGE